VISETFSTMCVGRLTVVAVLKRGVQSDYPTLYPAPLELVDQIMDWVVVTGVCNLHDVGRICRRCYIL
jgi:hypothetical protein